MYRVALLLALCCPGLALAQEVKMPQSVPVAVGRLAAVTMSYDGDDFAYAVPPELDAFREYGTDPKEVKLRVIGYTRGTYRIIAVTTKGGKLSPFQSCLVLVGGVSPVPTPDPTPEPQPDPTPPPPVAGPRVVTIIREAHQQTSQFADLVKSLRSGAGEKYLADKGHSLFFVDDEQKGPDGKPTALVESWRSVIGGMQLPVMVIHDAKTRNILSRESLAPTLSDANVVIEALKKAGG